MIKDYYDVIVIGAGPVGGYLAWKLTGKGLSVLLVEEHSEIGRPFQCAGMVNPSAMDRIGAFDTVMTRIWGARMYSPSGTEIATGDPNTTRTWSVCRKLFDERVVQLSLDSGADLVLSSRPIKADVTDSGVEVLIDIDGKTNQFNCRMLCGADGAHSWVRRTFKMGRPKELLIGFQIEVTGYPGEDGRLDLFTGNEFAPGFFAWAIPSGNTTRIGNWSLPHKLGEESCENLLKEFMTSSIWKDRFANCKEIGRYCGPVPSGLIHKPVIQRVAVFGDAAGLCKPTTGGGIGKGFEQVDLMLPKLVDAIKSNDFNKATVKDMNDSISSFRRNQNKARALRNVFLTESTDDELDELFAVWSQPEVIDLINQLGDIDNPIPLGIKMLKDVPEFRRLASKAAGALIWG